MVEKAVEGSARLKTQAEGAKPRPRRPNYKHIHRFPLPWNIHPLPVLIPHNPLSVISIALSYLTYFISSPPKLTFSAYFDVATSSVHVTDPIAIRALWEMGFFGKGTLSRSEPTWLEREKQKQGLHGKNTNEEITRKRRVERREFKLERAKKEKEAVAERLRAEGQLANGSSPVVPRVPAESSTGNILPVVDDREIVELVTTPDPVANGGTTSASGHQTLATPRRKSVHFSPIVNEIPLNKRVQDSDVTPEIEDQEHLQLSLEDAFFLVYALGTLQIYDQVHNSILLPQNLLALFRQHSYYPPRDPMSRLEPDDRFMVSYVACHHFRSLGWVVRSGVKFGVDLLLYNRGPVFAHAEFGVTLMPSYSHPYWKETEERRKMVASKQKHTWWWLHCVNRVQAQVKKTLILCFVEIPPPCIDPRDQDIGNLLQSYKVREMAVKRWVPNRSRD
ncbi:hypothetical protein FQN57_007262 [Myotisia sp. PD_48]|nr:hypothetical protein FQN57_007262 [Myotisia sp. PD_48]